MKTTTTAARMTKVRGVTMMLFATESAALQQLRAFPGGAADVTMVDYQGKYAVVSGAGARKLGLV